MYHMKTATVRDLRNRFADISKWIEEGESVTITRRGVEIATIIPPIRKKLKRKTWAQRFKEFPALGKPMTQAETDAFWAALRD